MPAPLIAITADADPERYFSRRPYADAVVAAGGIPIILPPVPALASEYLDRIGGLILSGGDDPIMEPFGKTTHPKATPIDPMRQEFELALLDELRRRKSVPVLGICLGMQLMALHAGGEIDQHLPDDLPTADDHWGRKEHEINGPIIESLAADLLSSGSSSMLSANRVSGGYTSGGRTSGGRVLSHHRQAVINPGSLRIIATAPDGVIEAVRDEKRPFYLGVQWHPERTADETLGLGLIRQLVEAARASTQSSRT